MNNTNEITSTSRSVKVSKRQSNGRSQLLTVFAVLLCLLFGGKAWGQTKTYTGTGSYSSTNPDIPIGSTNITFSLAMNSCDYDLYVKEGSSSVTTSDYTCRPYSSSGKVLQPGLPGVPMERNQSAPSRMILGTLA